MEKGGGGSQTGIVTGTRKQQQGDEIYNAVGLTAQVQLYLNAARS